MSKSYKVAIVDADASSAKELGELLERLGHRVLLRTSSMSELVQDALLYAIDLVICEVHSGRDFSTKNGTANRLHDVPIVIIADEFDASLFESNFPQHVYGVLLNPIREAELAAMIVVTAQRSHEFNQLREEASSLRAALDDRKLIEQAKGIVMKKNGMDEGAAFQQLKHLAREHRQKLAEVAKGIIIAERVFVPIQPDPIPPTSGTTNDSAT